MIKYALDKDIFYNNILRCLTWLCAFPLILFARLKLAHFLNWSDLAGPEFHFNFVSGRIGSFMQFWVGPLKKIGPASDFATHRLHPCNIMQLLLHIHCNSERLLKVDNCVNTTGLVKEQRHGQYQHPSSDRQKLKHCWRCLRYELLYQNVALIRLLGEI